MNFFSQDLSRFLFFPFPLNFQIISKINKQANYIKPHCFNTNTNVFLVYSTVGSVPGGPSPMQQFRHWFLSSNDTITLRVSRARLLTSSQQTRKERKVLESVLTLTGPCPSVWYIPHSRWEMRSSCGSRKGENIGYWGMPAFFASLWWSPDSLSHTRNMPTHLPRENSPKSHPATNSSSVPTLAGRRAVFSIRFIMTSHVFMIPELKDRLSTTRMVEWEQANFNTLPCGWRKIRETHTLTRFGIVLDRECKDSLRKHDMRLD